MPKDKATFRVEYDGQVVELDINDVNGLEARDFRNKVGMSFKAAFVQADAGQLDDLEPIAGLLWIVKRRDKPELEYDDVLASISYGSIVTEDEDKTEEPPDPPA